MKFDIPESLIYLDADFISRLYEAETGTSPKTVITSTQSLEASASIAFFSGGGTTTESRGFEVSSGRMLSQLDKRLSGYPLFDANLFTYGSPSKYFWLHGILSITKVKHTRTKSTLVIFGSEKPSKPSEEHLGEEAYFSFRHGESKFALAPSDQYFMPGVAAFKGMANLLVERLGLPARALVRVFSAHTYAKEWIATPVVIYDASTPAGQD